MAVLQTTSTFQTEEMIKKQELARYSQFTLIKNSCFLSYFSQHYLYSINSIWHYLAYKVHLFSDIYLNSPFIIFLRAQLRSRQQILEDFADGVWTVPQILLQTPLCTHLLSHSWFKSISMEMRPTLIIKIEDLVSILNN